MRPADLHQSVADSLQADVMRFMAIIAFCLIAILALVRSVAPVEPHAEPAGGTPAPAQPGPAVPAEPVSGRAAASPEPVRSPAAAPAEPVSGRATASPRPARAPAAALTEPVSEPATVSPRAARSAAAAPTEPEQEEGLSLRFASEQDFLRLVNRGRIQVFAFNGDEVLALDTDFSFRPAPAPGEVHELLPETIPDRMAGALGRRHGDGYRWGVAMPEAMARQIRRYLNDGATGELIINRFGEVRHRGA